ncbi:MAG: hypothetical protein CBB96_00865 [Gammaproteobacteria bacterium TMED36]|nr:MAG: hypothetical protein CBB96_00865 [Gammaproteobacteria bacterium TMED36]|tara:strand:+ start:2010 stop:2426 length:417 start_codon:yes stop_codon:yes gene_type:complete
MSKPTNENTGTIIKYECEVNDKCPICSGFVNPKDPNALLDLNEHKLVHHECLSVQKIPSLLTKVLDDHKNGVFDEMGLSDIEILKYIRMTALRIIESMHKEHSYDKRMDKLMDNVKSRKADMVSSEMMNNIETTKAEA